jgi:hypothetical protein
VELLARTIPTTAAERASADAVERRPVRRTRQVQRAGDHEERHQPERRVEREDPPPRQVVDRQPADQGPAHRGDDVRCAQQAKVAATLAGAHDLADDGLGADHQPARADALQHAKRDERRRRLRGAAQHGPGHEHPDRDEQHRLAPVPVAELAVERHRRGRRREECGEHGGHEVEPTEVGRHGGQRRRHDRLV